MAIDDNTSYELTGAQVKDLAARIKAGGGGGMTVYVDASFATPSSITGVFSDSALTTPADPDAMAGIISAGSTVIVVYDGGQSEEVIELSSVNSNSRFPEVGQAFTSAISTNAVFSAPTIVTLLYDGTLDSWSVETATIPAAQVNSDWNANSGVEQILNKPEIRHVNAVSDAGWSADADKLVDGSVLAYWNGAYSGTTSNLQYFKNNSIGCNHFNEWSTANTADTWVPVGNGNKIQHRVIKAFNSDGSIPTSAIANSAVTTDKINGSAVTKAKMHGLPAPDPSSVITNWGSITASGNNEKTMSADGFVVGKGCTFGSDQSALVKLNGQEVGGVSYTTFTGYMQVVYCFPVRSGDKVQFYLNKSGPQHQGCKLIGWKM